MPNFWETLGRGIGHGLRKAREVTDRLTDEAEGKLDIREARQRLGRAHEALGEAVADAAADGRVIADGHAPIAERLAAVQAARRTLAELEAQRPAAEESDPEASAPGGPDSGAPDERKSP